MMLGIGKELGIFLVALLDGIFVALAYSAIRVFRRIIRHNMFWISIEDIAFWVSVGLFIFTELFRVCSGNIRWYFVLGVFLGGSVTCYFVQKLMKKYIDNSSKTR